MEESSGGRDILEAAEAMARIRTDTDERARWGVGGIDLEGDGILACSRYVHEGSENNLSTHTTPEARKHIRRVSQ
jgi:hypothetical protein